MKSLLSPDLAKKSRKKHRQHSSKTSTHTQKEQISNSQPSITTSDTSVTSKKSDILSSTTDNKYLSMETRFVFLSKFQLMKLTFYFFQIVIFNQLHVLLLVKYNRTLVQQ